MAPEHRLPYAYPAAATPRPHAICSITGTVNTIFTYDANGNMIAGNGRTVTYTTFNMAESITQGSSTVNFTYDANHERIKQVAPEGTTVYVAGGIERFAATSGLVQWNEYLMAGKQRVGVHMTRSDSTQNTRYFVTDHLGSVAVLTDEMGAVVERLAYDAWGKRRHPNGADDPTGSITSQTTRGFTGHEHIASVGLINMNARIYDPQLGRFMTPDSLVEDIYLSQILNRFTYVGNNPLSIVDPTGRSWLSSLFRRVPILRAILAIAIAVIFQQHWAWFGLPSATAGAIVGGLLSGFISGGTLKSALIGALTAFAFTDIHKMTLSFGERVLAHGLVGGLASEAQGGNFASGFLAAGFSALVAPFVGTEFSARGLAISAIAGGVGSVLGGGKFENGAITGAFSYLFNHVWDRDALGPGAKFGSADEAAKDFARYTQARTLIDLQEAHSRIFEIEDWGFSYTEPTWGPRCTLAIGYCVAAGVRPIPRGATTIANIHSHPLSDRPSGGDLGTASRYPRWRHIVVGSQGTLWEIFPSGANSSGWAYAGTPVRIGSVGVDPAIRTERCRRYSGVRYVEGC